MPMSRERMREIALLNFEHFLRDASFSQVFQRDDFERFINLSATRFTTVTDAPIAISLEIMRLVFYFDFDDHEPKIRRIIPEDRRAQVGELLLRRHAKIVHDSVRGLSPLSATMSLSRYFFQLIRHLSEIGISNEEAKSFAQAHILNSCGIEIQP